MSANPFTRISNNGLTVTAYPGDGDVLLAYSLDPALLKQNDLAGFAIQYTPPGGQAQFVSNRLNFTQPVTSGTQPQSHPWTSSQDAPIQKFHWVHFPTNVLPGTFTYKVTARYWQGTNLVDGPSAQVPVELVPAARGNFELGMTRGYISSQAYATHFQNQPVRPSKTLDYDTAPLQPAYEWLGFHARKMVFDLLQECVNDKSTTVDLFAYDLDEPDIVKMLESLGPRLRAFLDNAPLHTGKALEVTVHDRLVKSAGAANIKQGHFQRFAHKKIIIQKKNGKAVKVLTGSANFSVRGLYVQANNILQFNDTTIAEQYEQIFQSVFDNMAGYVKTPLAGQWFKFPGNNGTPAFQVSFAPHPKPPFSMVTVADALAQAKSSVLFAVMALGGSGKTMQTLNGLHLSGKVFSYGMTQSQKGFTVYKPGQPGILVPFATLAKQVPPPFNKEFDGGPGQTIHDKFVVIDFNDANPMVFTGSSNLADGGESQNGDNLLAISDPAVASVFAAEAVRLVDHYYFRAAARAATSVKPLVLSASENQQKWWQRDYDPNNMRNVQRELLANGPGAVSTIPSGASDTPPAGGSPQPKGKTKKKPSTKKAPAKGKKKSPAKGKKKSPAKKKTAKKKAPRKPAKKTAKKKASKKKATKKGGRKKSTRR
jgi:phosphatidylserine/phosphatidylglycerophosphate/cardiolipin synthase-like enzyme